MGDSLDNVEVFEPQDALNGPDQDHADPITFATTSMKPLTTVAGIHGG